MSLCFCPPSSQHGTLKTTFSQLIQKVLVKTIQRTSHRPNLSRRKGGRRSMSSNLLKEVRNKKIYFLYGYPGNDSYEKAALNAKKPWTIKRWPPAILSTSCFCGKFPKRSCEQQVGRTASLTKRLKVQQEWDAKHH